MSAPMTAEGVFAILATVEQAVTTDQPLTFDQIQALSDAKSFQTDDLQVRKAVAALKEFCNDLDRQSAARMRAQSEKSMLEGLRELGARNQKRREEWRAQDPTYRTLVWEMGDQFTKRLEQETNAPNTEPPPWWQPGPA